MNGKNFIIVLLLPAAVIAGVLLAFMFRAEWFPEQLVVRYHPVEKVAFQRYATWRRQHPHLDNPYQFPARRFSFSCLESQLHHADPTVAAPAAMMLIAQYGVAGMNVFLTVAENPELRRRVLADPLPPTALNALRTILEHPDEECFLPALAVLQAAPITPERDRLIAENLAHITGAAERAEFIAMLPSDDNAREVDDSLKWELLRLCREDPSLPVRLAALAVFGENGFATLLPEAEQYFLSLAVNPATEESVRRQAVRNLLNRKTDHLLTLLAIADPPDYVIEFKDDIGRAFAAVGNRDDFPGAALGALLLGQNDLAAADLNQARDQGIINHRFRHQYTALDLALMLKVPEPVRLLRQFGAKTAAELPSATAANHVLHLPPPLAPTATPVGAADETE
ncbi:MAG: hypothetical protein PHQ27_02035 [Victivallales bacterium]|nr:hypothetical protein [Victivallales bacterium]